MVTSPGSAPIKSYLEYFEPKFALRLTRNSDAVKTTALSRSAAIGAEIENAGRPLIGKMRRIKSWHKTQISELKALQYDLLTKLKKKWLGVKVKRIKNHYDSKYTLQNADMPSIPQPPSVCDPNSPQSCAYEPAIDALNDASSLLDADMPIMSKSRGMLWSSEEPMVTEALRKGSQAIADEERLLNAELNAVVSDIYAVMAATGSKYAIFAADKVIVDKTNAELALTPVAGSIGEGIPYPLAKRPKGHGRLLFQCGWMAHSHRLRTSKDANIRLGYSALLTPCVIDLTEEHGFLTTSDCAVKSFILRALNTLPAGSMTFSVYDPKAMGDFVKYLYPLGDKQEAILGKGGVFTTQNQLQNLLEEVERHIGVINQKYLAGKYNDLVAYNKDAGVSFEPYRVLVINDNPSQWAAAYRQELVNQLIRIIQAGSRCGVFVIVKSDAPCYIGLPVLDGNPANSATKYSSRPYLTDGPVKSVDRDAVMSSGSLSGCYALSETNAWFAPYDGMGIFNARGQADIVNSLEKELQNAGAVEMSPQNVAAISRLYRDAQSSKGVKFGLPVIEFDDASGWWRESSKDGLTAYVGIDKANQKKPRTVTFRGTPGEFGALVGGQPRSGKSTFLHALISELIRRYSPYELKLYLVDVKFGAEFKHYANIGLPHARVIALESGAEFALSVLKDLVDNMAWRYSVFKSEGVSKIDDYRDKTRKTMSRVLAVIDEFSGMFEVDNAVSEEATVLLTKLIQQGSAAGVHLVLASQSLATATAIPRKVLPQIPQRIVFKIPEQDSRLFLADDNPQAGALNRPGEGIYNPSNGRKDANEGFQGTLMTHADLKITLDKVCQLAKAKGVTKEPIILENPGAASWTIEARDKARASVENLNLTLPIGMPLSLEPCVCVSLEQTVGGNALVCVHNEATYIDVVATLVWGSASGSASGGTRVMLLDFLGNSGILEKAFSRYEAKLAQKLGKRFSVTRGRGIYEAIEKLAARTEDALVNNQTPSAPAIVVVTGLSKATNLNQLSPVALQFQELLAKGAAVGIHVVVAADSLGAVKSKLGYSWQDSFSTFITGSCGSGDSMELAQSRIASELDNDEQIVVYDKLTGKTQKIRPFKLSSFSAPQ